MDRCQQSRSADRPSFHHISKQRFSCALQISKIRVDLSFSSPTNTCEENASMSNRSRKRHIISGVVVFPSAFVASAIHRPKAKRQTKLKAGRFSTQNATTKKKHGRTNDDNHAAKHTPRFLCFGFLKYPAGERCQAS